MLKANSRPPARPLSRHRLRPLAAREAVVMVLVGAVASLAPLLYGRQQAQYGYAKFGPVAAQFWSRPWYLISLVAVLTFCLLVLTRLISTSRKITLHKTGLELSFPRRNFLKWENISGMAVEIRGAKNYRYNAWIFPGTGKPIYLPSTTHDLPHLLTQIKAHLYPRLLPELQASFAQGKWIYFGPVSIQSNFIRLPGQFWISAPKTYPWKQVTRVSVRSGKLVVEFNQGGRREYPASRIPNIEILLQIIQSGVTA